MSAGLLMTLAAWLLGCGSAAVVTPAPPEESLPLMQAPPPPGWLAFVSEAPGHPVVHLVRTDGTDERAVAGCPDHAYPGPADPLGQAVLLHCSNAHEDGRHVEQLLLAPVSGAPVALTPPVGLLRSPAWAPDGASLVVESDHRSFRDLYRVPRAGGDPVQLTDHKHGQFEPSIAADGRLTFVSSRDMNAEVYTSDAAGGGLSRLTDHPRDDMQPAWSPDGGKIAFISARTGEARVWWMNADGSAPAHLIPGMGTEHLALAWSPDGARLAITARDHGQRAAYVLIVAVAGPAIEAAIRSPEGSVEHPAWSPDGAWLAWDQAAGKNVDLWVGRRDGRDARPVTRSVAAEWLPRWLRLPP